MSSCSSTNSGIGKEQAAIIAKKEAVSWGWKEVEVRDASFIDGQWQVMVWMLPKSPGGFALVKISSDGKTIRIVRGK